MSERMKARARTGKAVPSGAILPGSAPAGPAPSRIDPGSPGTGEGQRLSPLEGFTHDRLRELHRALLIPRIIEEKMLLLLRQGRLSKWFSGIGQEAIAVGVTSALAPDDWILPMHRTVGVVTPRGVDLARLLR